MTGSKVVLTTGANSGLGRAVALEFAARGHRSIGTVRSEAKADELRAAAAERGVEVETMLLDVTDADRCAEVIEAARPDVLVNNAGYMLYGAIEEVDDDAARALLETMVIAPMRLARLCVPLMRASGGGRIIQISSLSARFSFPLMGWYQASKQALEGASDALRLEVERDGIAVVLIEPGLFRSELSNEFTDLHGTADSRYADAYERTRSGFARIEGLMTQAEAVARVVVRAALARSPRARYPVGLDAQMSVLTEPFTFDSLRDAILRRSAGLT